MRYMRQQAQSYLLHKGEGSTQECTPKKRIRLETLYAVICSKAMYYHYHHYYNYYCYLHLCLGKQREANKQPLKE